MKYWDHKVFVGLGPLIAMSILIFSVPAFAQFEVSPDHFDSSPTVEKKQAAKTSVKKTGALTAKAGKSNQDNAQIAVAANHSQTSSTAGKSQGNGQSAVTTNAAVAKRKKRVAPSKVALASTQ